MRTDFAEEYYSLSHHGVLRGLHFQTPPMDHAKLVYCADGEVLDAVVDLRRGSPTYGEYQTFIMSSEAGNILYIPSGFAHGFYVTGPSALMIYKVTAVYVAENDSGIRWNSTGIPWPDENPVLSGRDRTLPPLADFSSPFDFCRNLDK